MSESPELSKVLDALRIGKVACEWAGHFEDATKCSEAMEVVRGLVKAEMERCAVVALGAGMEYQEHTKQL